LAASYKESGGGFEVRIRMSESGLTGLNDAQGL